MVKKMGVSSTFFLDQLLPNDVSDFVMGTFMNGTRNIMKITVQYTTVINDDKRNKYTIENIFEKAYFLVTAVEKAAQNSAQDSAVYHKPFSDIQNNRGVLNNRRQLYDPVQYLGAHDASHYAPDCNIKDMIPVQIVPWGPLLRYHHSHDYTDGNHQPVAVHSKGTYGK